MACLEFHIVIDIEKVNRKPCGGSTGILMEIVHVCVYVCVFYSVAKLDIIVNSSSTRLHCHIQNHHRGTFSNNCNLSSNPYIDDDRYYGDTGTIHWSKTYLPYIIDGSIDRIDAIQVGSQC